MSLHLRSDQQPCRRVRDAASQARSAMIVVSHGVPHFRRFVLTGGRQLLAVGASSDAQNWVNVAAEGQEFLAAFRVPHAR